jgi:dolichol-phosphate mannosyltransferase
LRSKQDTELKITLITPTYNEAENLPKLLQALFALPLENLNVLVVDDNSKDGTGEIAEDLKKTYKGKLDVMHRAGKLGLGTAYIQGFTRLLVGDSEAIGQIDADFSHEPAKVVELAEALKTCDVALGSRYVPGGSLDKDWPYWRKALSSFGNVYARTILNLPIHDTTGGFRLWRRETLAAMPLERVRSNGYIFQVEMAFIANKLGFHFKEVPIYFAERQYGQSKMSLRIQVEAALRVWALRGLYRDLKPLTPSNKR